MISCWGQGLTMRCPAWPSGGSLLLYSRKLGVPHGGLLPKLKEVARMVLQLRMVQCCIFVDSPEYHWALLFRD